LLDLAGTAWQDFRWTDGILRVLDGLDLLLESIAVEEVAGTHGDF
jgi:hypothetical protein